MSDVFLTSWTGGFASREDAVTWPRAAGGVGFLVWIDVVWGDAGGGMEAENQTDCKVKVHADMHAHASKDREGGRGGGS